MVAATDQLDPDQLLTVPEAAIIMGCSDRSVSRMIRCGRLPGIRIGAGTERARYRVRRGDVTAILRGDA